MIQLLIPSKKILLSMIVAIGMCRLVLFYTNGHGYWYLVPLVPYIAYCVYDVLKNRPRRMPKPDGVYPEQWENTIIETPRRGQLSTLEIVHQGRRIPALRLFLNCPAVTDAMQNEYKLATPEARHAMLKEFLKEYIKARAPK